LYCNKTAAKFSTQNVLPNTRITFQLKRKDRYINIHCLGLGVKE